MNIIDVIDFVNIILISSISWHGVRDVNIEVIDVTNIYKVVNYKLCCPNDIINIIVSLQLYGHYYYY